MTNSAPVDPIRVENITDRITKMVWTCGRRAVTLVAGGIDFNIPEDCDPKDPRFVGVFDEHAGTGDVRENVRFTLQRLQEVAA